MRLFALLFVVRSVSAPPGPCTPHAQQSKQRVQFWKHFFIEANGQSQQFNSELLFDLARTEPVCMLDYLQNHGVPERETLRTYYKRSL